MKLTVAVAGAFLLAACGFMPVPSAAEPLAAGAPQISFSMPESWARLGGTATDAHYFTTGDPDVCANVVGVCDPTTYVMAPGTIDVAITPAPADRGCADVGEPTWDARIEDRAAAIREATYRLTWSVCFADTGDVMQIAADLRAADLEVRDDLLGELREFVESIVFVSGDGQLAPEK